MEGYYSLIPCFLRLSRYTLSDLSDTRIGRASRAAVITVAVVDGLSPFLAALIVLIPFFVSDLFPSIRIVYFTAIGMALFTLFALGLFLGQVSRGSLPVYGIKTVLAGVVSIVISFLLGEWG